jgi:transposase InsO family protein
VGSHADGQKKGFVTVSRTSDTPGQTVNVDLCFVPAQHAPNQKLPAVSRSSGRLIVERPATAATNRTWLGQIFADSSLGYEAAMQHFARASHQRFQDRKHHAPAPDSTPDPHRAVRAEAAGLRMRRRVVRERRNQEDQAWRELWNTRKAVLDARRRAGGSLGVLDAADDQRWQVLRQHRHTTLVEREAHDTTWRTAHQALRHAVATEPLPTAWRAILRVTDNCTRQCYDLPLFASGGRVSAAEIVTSVEHLLPTTVHVVISIQGTHFMAPKFQQFAARAGFVHVPIARHRPESNGIAERCVRTLKAWLRQYAWNLDEELLALLAQFVTDYNERPLQGLGIPGLSPNEFTKRVWLF